MFLAVSAFQWILSCSVVNVSCGISVRNGKYVAMVLLIILRLFCCVGVRWGEWFMMGKYMSAFGNVTVACL